MRLRIATILVGHEPDAYRLAFEKCNELMKSICPDAIRSTIIVDNAQPRAAVDEISEDLSIVGGDNQFREFSAWDQGLAELHRRRLSPDIIHLVTTAFDSLYVDYLKLFNRDSLFFAHRKRCAIGHIDYYNEPVEIVDRVSQSWMRTAFFFLPAEALRRLRTTVSIEPGESFFTKDPSEPFAKDAPVSERYRQYIESWLTGGDTGQGVRWHSAFRLDEQTLPLFRAKATAILNEHLFSIRLRSAGFPLCDIAWLREQLRLYPEQEIDAETDWSTQIRGRP